MPIPPPSRADGQPHEGFGRRPVPPAEQPMSLGRLGGKLASLGDERDRLDAILGVTSDGVLVLEPGGQLVYANGAAARMLGFPSPEALLSADRTALAGRYAPANGADEGSNP